MAVERKAFQTTTHKNSFEKEIHQGKSINAKSLSMRPHIYVGRLSIEQEDAYIFLSGNDFREIFGVRHGDSQYYRRHPAIVKITRGKKRIYRQFHTLNTNQITNYAALSYNSLLALSNTAKNLRDIDTISLSPSKGWLTLYWKHPIFSRVTSNRQSIIAIILAIIGIILSLIALFK